MSETQHDNPGVIAPPPLIYAAGLLIGIGLNAVIALPLPFTTPPIIALVLVVIGLASGVWALWVMYQARTSPLPERPTTAIVSSGVFAFSRNPIYLGFTLIYLGVTLWVNTWWLVLLLPVVLAVMHYGVILREERYLEGKFGEAYLAYKRRVRRWI